MLLAPGGHQTMWLASAEMAMERVPPPLAVEAPAGMAPKKAQVTPPSVEMEPTLVL
jgi:hypothetical protein